MREIAFIDSSVADSAKLAASVRAGTEVVMLDESHDPIAQISDHLRAHRDLNAIHLVSHGEPGAIFLGSIRLDTAMIGRRALEIAAWRTSINPGGDILLYGCEVGGGAEGRSFLRALAESTGADVAASTNRTGNQLLQADWMLEERIGRIDTPALATSNYAGVLASGTITFTSSSGLGGTVVQDGQGGSTDISGITIEISDGWSNTWTYENPYGNPAIAAGYDFNDSSYLITIKSSSQSVNFNFQSIFMADYGGAPAKVTAYDGGVSRGSVNLNTTANGYENTFNQSNGLTASIFQNVDEIRIQPQSGSHMWIAINHIQIGDAVVPDSTPPTISSVSSSTANGTYKVGDTVAITVLFDENVTVTGTPTLALNSGGTATYASGSGTSTLVFNYTIGAGDSSSDLDYSATNSLSLSGGTIRDAASNSATLTLASPGAANSLGANKALAVDGIAPTVSSVGVPANATYIAGQNLDFTVNLTESVTVNTGGGTPYLAVTLDTGGAVQAAYLSGTGTSSLVFRYTVTSGNVDNNGIALGSAILINGGTLRDAAGNSATLTLNSVGSTTSVLVDAVAPAISSISRAGSTPTNATSLDFTIVFSKGVSGVDTSDFSLTTTGTAAGAIASVNATNSSTYTVTVNTISGNGTLRLDVKSSGTGISDTPGNAISGGYTSGQSYTIDTTPPTAPVIDGITSDTGASASDGITSDSNLALSGSAEAGSTVTLLSSGSPIGTTTANGGGAWTFDYSATTLADGGYSFTATATDAVGNVSSASSAFAVTIDATAPAAPVIVSITGDSGASSSDHVTSDVTLALAGTGEANTTITLSLAGVGAIGSTTADGSGNWTFDYTGTTLADGTHDFTAQASDTAGNASATSTTLSVVVDATSPSVPVITGINDDTGSSASDAMTSDANLVLVGTAEAGSTVTLTRTSAGTIGATIADGSGQWSFDYTAVTLASGEHTFSATASDTAGNTSGDSSDFVVTVDASSPAAPVITAISSDTGVSATDGITSDTTLLLSGTAEAGSVVTVSRSGAGTLGTATVDGSGTWSYDYMATPLADGSYLFVATTTDSAGNTSSSSADFPVTIDTTAPAAPVISAVSNDSGLSSTDRITSDTTLVLTGTTEPDSIVTLARSGIGTVGTTTADGSGNWSFDHTGTVLGDGTYSFTATASDAPGNTSASSATFSVTVDTTGPSIVTQPVGGTYAAGDSFALQVAATDAGALSYQWYLGTAALSDGSNRSGSTSATIAHTSVGTTGFGGVYTVVVSDEAGNTSTSTVATVVVNGADQTITFPAIADRLSTASPFTVGATASSGLSVTFSVVSGPASISGTSVTLLGAGTVTIRASQAGDANYNPASVDRVFLVTKAVATVALSNLIQTYDGSTRSVTATTTPAGLTVDLIYDGSPTAPAAAGHYPVTAIVVDAIYQGTVSGTLVIGKADQTIDFTPVGAIAVGSAVALHATASSGLPVTFSIIEGNATISGTTLAAADATTITLRATQSGDSNYNPATSDQSISSSDIAKLDQTITFVAPGDKLTGDAPFALVATASSGLPVSFAVESGPAAISGSTLTLSGAPGTVTIMASQAGDDTFGAAEAVTHIFKVTAPDPLTYFGELTASTQASKFSLRSATVAAGVGDFAAHLSADGTNGTMLGYLPDAGVGFVVQFTPDADGAFSVTTTALSSDVDEPPVQLTFRGTLAGAILSGHIDELGIDFAGIVDAPDGPTAAMSGFYQSSSLDTTDGAVYSIVGTTGEVYVLAVIPGQVEGDSTVVEPETGAFSFVTQTGATLTGRVDQPTTTVSGFLVQSSGASTGFAGVLTGTTRTDRIVNFSSRAHTASAEQMVITGFVVSEGTKQLLIRAVGTGLSNLGVFEPIADPRLRIFRGSELIYENDDWGAGGDRDALVRAIYETGAFSLAAFSTDSALLVTLMPGAYTAQIDSARGEGVALAEIYDASQNPEAEPQRLVNLSTRGPVGEGENALISGFVVTGNAPKRVLVRGIGPGLVQHGISSALADPILTVYAGGSSVAGNDNWGAGANTASELVAAASATGAFALESGSADAAVLVTLAPGAYTAKVSGAAGAAGIALIEIFEIPTN